MGFEKFGVRSFVRETKADHFVTLLEKGIIGTTKCTQCEHTSFPPRMDCPKCGSGAVEWIKIEETGRLVAFTRVIYGPAGFEGKVPYMLGVVAFGNGIKMFGEIDSKIRYETVGVGMGLKAVPVRLEEGRFSYHFERV